MKLPEAFTIYTRSLLGDADYDAFEAALQTDPVVSLRTNSGKSAVEAASSPVRLTPVPWATDGYYVAERPTFTFDPLFHAGCYYVQEASSMFLEQALRRYVTRPSVVLDLCAAPGGKSTHVRSLLPEGSLLVSNEVMRSRVQVLAENLVKWGHPDVVVTNNDPADFRPLRQVFDVVLTDVPCSGEGMFRKDPASREEWSPANVRLCAERQRQILSDIWGALKPGGLLVYSTCTYNTEEDEDAIHYIIEQLGAEPLAIPTDPAWQITGSLRDSLPVYRFLPHKTRGEGFFLAALRKSDDGDIAFSPKKTKEKRAKKTAVRPFPRDVESYLTDARRFVPCWTGADGTILRMQSETVARLAILFSQQSVRILSAGIEIGEQKGKDLIPAEPLALSTALNPARFPAVELERDEAIRYLRKESLVLPETVERGFVLRTYRQQPLGFVKNLGNRSNNLAPAEWKIRING